jgi:hypothetical protein
LVLAGTPALAEKWSASGTTHIPHCICLEPLSSVEVSEYIKHRLRLADVSEGTTLTDATCALIAERSQGIPANINRLCLHALNGRGASVDEQLAIDNTTAKPESDDARDDHTMPSQPRALPERHAATVVVWPILLMGVVLLGVSLWYARLEPAFSKVAAKALARSHLKAVAEKVDNPAPPARISTGPPPPAVAAESPRPDVVAAPSSPISRETRAASPLQGAAMRRSIPPTVQRADKVAAHDQQRSHPSATTVADTELVALAIRLGEADMRLGKYDRAIGILRQALARVPGDAQLLGQIRRARRAKAAEAATLSE